MENVTVCCVAELTARTLMGSRVERRHDVTPAGCLSTASVDAGDMEEGWSGVELALAFVDQMVGGLAELADGLPLVDADGSDLDEVFRLDDQLTSSRPPVSQELNDEHEDEDATSAVDDGTGRCISDACSIL